MFVVGHEMSQCPCKRLARIANQVCYWMVNELNLCLFMIHLMLSRYVASYIVWNGCFALDVSVDLIKIVQYNLNSKVCNINHRPFDTFRIKYIQDRMCVLS